MNKKRILKGNEFHFKAINRITVELCNNHNVPLKESTFLASSIPVAIMDYDEDGDLVMSSQLFQHICGMSIGYKLGVDSGVKSTVQTVKKQLDSLGK